MPEETRSFEAGRGDQGGRGGRGGRDGGRGRGGRSGEGRSSNNQGGNNYNSEFEGQQPLLKACMFDYSKDPQAKQYIKNVELLIGYVGSKFTKYNVEFQKAIEALDLKMPSAIPVPPDNASNIAIKVWEMKEKKRDKQIMAYKSFLASFYTLLLGQCTELLKNKLKAQTEYKAITQARDGIKLLKLIRKITFAYNSKRVSTVHAMDKFRYNFYTLKRRPGQSVHKFYEVFKAKLKVCVELDIKIPDQCPVEEVAIKNSRTLATATDEDEKEAHERAAAMRFIRASGSQEYEAHLRNKFLDGEDVYPKTLADARAIIDNRVQATKRNDLTPSEGTGTGVAFHTQSQSTNSNEVKPATTGATYS